MDKQKAQIKAQADDAPPDDAPRIMEETTVVGILIAKKHKVIPDMDERKHVHYAVYGNVAKSLQEIYNNTPIGSLDVLNGIKAARQMIWMLRTGGVK